MHAIQITSELANASSVRVPQVAKGPYTLYPSGDIVAADATPIGRVPVRWSDLRTEDFASVREGWAFAEERARLEGSLLAAAPDLLAVCEEWLADFTGYPLSRVEALTERTRAAVNKARGVLMIRAREAV